MHHLWQLYPLLRDFLVMLTHLLHSSAKEELSGNILNS